MKARATIAATAAALVSISLHGAGVVSLSPPEAEALSAGATQIAMIGNSFEDAVAGVVTGTTAPTEQIAPLVPETPALATPPVPATATPVSVTGQAAPVVPGAMSVLPVGEISPLTATVPQAAVAPSPPPPMSSPAATLTPPAAIRAVSPVVETARTTAAPDPVVQTPTDATPRPQPRRARPDPPPPTPTPARQQPAPPVPQGNAEVTTRTGQATGQAQGTGTQTAAGGAAQSQSDGRSIARYPQLVNRHLSRLRRPNARFDGAAVIAFSIAGNGGVSAVSVARSSGNAAFDQIAVAHIQRAAPFPPPPEGAQRRFNVTVQAR